MSWVLWNLPEVTLMLLSEMMFLCDLLVVFLKQVQKMFEMTILSSSPHYVSLGSEIRAVMSIKISA